MNSLHCLSSSNRRHACRQLRCIQDSVESSVPGDDWEFVSADRTESLRAWFESNSHAVGQIMDATGLQSLLATLDSSVRLNISRGSTRSASRMLIRTQEEVLELARASSAGTRSTVVRGA